MGCGDRYCSHLEAANLSSPVFQINGITTKMAPVPISFLDLLKGRQLLHTTYKMFMAAAGVEGEVLSVPDFEFS